MVSIWKIPAATSLKISWHAVDRPPLPRTVGPASSCAQLHNSLGDGNAPQGGMEVVLYDHYTDAAPTPDPALDPEPALVPDLALDPENAVLDP